MAQPDTIYHIAIRAEWNTALEQGAYTISSLENEGFIHCSRADQVAKVANSYFKDVPNLVLLHLAVEKLATELRWEPVEDDLYPHIYGPINLEAVTQTQDFLPGEDGIFVFPKPNSS
jgi:uncharacterized protein (DUF952 family)